MRRPRLSCIAGMLFATLMILALNPERLPASEPLNMLKSVTDQALLVLKDPLFQSKSKKKRTH